MKYLSLDIETTCISPQRPQNILQCAMVFEDTNNPEPINNLPHLNCYIKHDVISGTAYALGMNGWILDIISGRKPSTSRYPVVSLEEFIYSAHSFLDQYFGEQKITVAGKNVAGFDIPFLPSCISKRFHHRVMDPAMLHIDWTAETTPSLGEIKSKAGWLGEKVAHDALEDARDVIRVLRLSYAKQSV